jgi:hypothetical protein
MKKPLDYLLMRTPPARMSDTGGAKPGEVPTKRVIISIFGLFVGIFASFFVTGIHVESGQALSAPQAVESETGATPSPEAPRLAPISRRLLWQTVLISLVICGLTYQQLYFSLKLYEGEPTFLIFFISFQYGYFWQSVIKGATAILTAT